MTPEKIASLPYRPCVGIVVARADGLVFAGKRIDNPGPAWQMPQGGIDNGEAPQAAALRELEEETGIPPSSVEVAAETPDWLRYDLPHDLVPRIWKGRYRGQEQLWFLMRFEGPDDLIDIGGKHAEFSQWAWMEPEDLIEKIVPFKRAIYSQVFSSFGGMLGQ